ncbi:hypothetical protein BU25DRAFT_464881 [Macroventuria anomochaeta]|uniref:Uncharacterized protein n=1 Tax=Macroventuria anomochaeta TaxID=301207 RepID=A0ACB6SJ27_9PLEO|nr:uncharacterized protein BU25DRAFT_464881 [Macroventuria anomochaeta]KAF2633685.1 hypothetical protein BU25DRAFT_464881 [Macroventuria anomochaeta]
MRAYQQAETPEATSQYGYQKAAAQLDRLPTFSYSQAAKEAVTRHTGRAKERRTIHKAVSFYKDRKEYTRCISENIIDLARWEGGTRPRGYPAGLEFPGNTVAWREQNTDLRWLDNMLNIGTCALQSFKNVFILGEYAGELIPIEVSTDSKYLFDINDEDNETMACVDSVSFGDWTKYINHSYNANAVFQVVRVGEEARVVCKTRRRGREGEEVTIDYRENYWKF